VIASIIYLLKASLAVVVIIQAIALTINLPKGDRYYRESPISHRRIALQIIDIR
jgi:hypothetical protein